MYYYVPLATPFPLSSPFFAARGNGTPSPTATRPAIVVQPQSAGEVSQAFPSEIRACYKPELTFHIDGKVVRRPVKVGERAKKGQPLVEFDPQDVRLQLEAARVQVSIAGVNLQIVRVKYRHYHTLLDRSLISHSRPEDIQDSYRASETRLKQIRAEFGIADNQAGYAALRLSQGDVITSRRVGMGQVMTAGQAVFSLVADGEHETLIGLPEHGFKCFRIGQPTSVELWLQRDKHFTGHIRKLSPAADPRSRTFAARVAFGNRATPAELGRSTRVYVAVAEAVPLSVPLSALTAEAGQTFVWVVKPGNSTLRQQPVRTGPYAEDRVPALEDLKTGDWMVATGVQVLHEGQQVRPIDRANRAVKLAAKEQSHALRSFRLDVAEPPDHPVPDGPAQRG